MMLILLFQKKDFNKATKIIQDMERGGEIIALLKDRDFYFGCHKISLPDDPDWQRSVDVWCFCDYKYSFQNSTIAFLLKALSKVYPKYSFNKKKNLVWLALKPLLLFGRMILNLIDNICLSDKKSKKVIRQALVFGFIPPPRIFRKRNISSRKNMVLK